MVESISELFKTDLLNFFLLKSGGETSLIALLNVQGKCNSLVTRLCFNLYLPTPGLSIPYYSIVCSLDRTCLGTTFLPLYILNFGPLMNLEFICFFENL